MSGTSARGVAAIEAFFGGWRFAALVVFTLVFMTASMLAILLWPEGGGSLARFAEEFRIWCLGQEGRSGTKWGPAVGILVPPLLLIGFVLLLWGGPLREAARRPLRLVPWAGAALALVALAGVGFAAFDAPAPRAPLDFPAEELRTAIPPPSFRLLDQDRREVSLDPFRGRVVMLTAVYATCGYA